MCPTFCDDVSIRKKHKYARGAAFFHTVMRANSSLYIAFLVTMPFGSRSYGRKCFRSDGYDGAVHAPVTHDMAHQASPPPTPGVDFDFQNTRHCCRLGLLALGPLVSGPWEPHAGTDIVTARFIVQLVNGPDVDSCLLYTSPSPRDLSTSRMPSSA